MAGGNASRFSRAWANRAPGARRRSMRVRRPSSSRSGCWAPAMSITSQRHTTGGHAARPCCSACQRLPSLQLAPCKATPSSPARGCSVAAAALSEDERPGPAAARLLGACKAASTRASARAAVRHGGHQQRVDAPAHARRALRTGSRVPGHRCRFPAPGVARATARVCLHSTPSSGLVKTFTRIGRRRGSASGWPLAERTHRGRELGQGRAVDEVHRPGQRHPQRHRQQGHAMAPRVVAATPGLSGG